MSNKTLQELVPNDFLKMIQEIKKTKASDTVIMHQEAFGDEIDELLMLGASIKWANLNSINITIISDKQTPCVSM